MMDRRLQTISSLIGATVAVVALLYLGRMVFIPLALALLFAAVLHPAVRWLIARRLPAAAAAACVVLAFVTTLGVAGVALWEPVHQWIAKAPVALQVAGQRLQSLRRWAASLNTFLAPERTPQDPQPPSPTGTTRGSTPPDARSPSGALGASALPELAPLIGRLFGTTTELVGGAVEVVLLLVFLLAAGDTWRARVLQTAPSPATGRRIATILSEIRGVVARYLLVTLLINVGQGLLVGLALATIGMPAPLLWGGLTVVAEFIPYIGGLVMVGLLALVGLTSADHPGHALLAPALYLLITTLQNNVVSPVAYGQGLKLNPLVILVAVLIWWSLWGVAGAFLAVPILAGIRVLCERSEGLQGVGVWLGE